MNPLFPSWLASRLVPVMAPVQAASGRIAQRWRGSGAQRVWRLWLAELRACLPSPLQRLLIDDTPEHTFAWPLTKPVQTQSVEVRRILLLERSAALVQTLQLPVAAARNLAGVVGYELDRFTPFAASDLYFMVRQERRSAGSLQVTLVAILRERLDRILAECAALGLQPHAVDVRDRDGQPMGVDLLPPSLRQRQRRGKQGLPRKLAWLCGVLLIAAMWTWLDDRQRLLDQMQSVVQAQKAQAAQVQQIRLQLTNSLGAASYLIRRKTEQPALAALLDELTRCLPRDTWIEQLEIRDGAEVSFSGQSAKASALIARIKDCRRLENAQFQGVIQPDAQTGNDRFSLRARLHKEAADAQTTDHP